MALITKQYTINIRFNFFLYLQNIRNFEKPGKVPEVIPTYTEEYKLNR